MTKLRLGTPFLLQRKTCGSFGSADPSTKFETVEIIVDLVVRRNPPVDVAWSDAFLLTCRGIGT
jgi:hypothetical protein